MAGADKNFKITFDVDANIGPLKTAVGQIQGAFNKVNIPANFKKGIEDTLSKLTSEITNFESIASKGFNNLGDVSKANKSFEKITDLFSKLKIQAKDIQGIDLKKFLPAETVKKTKELGEAWVKVKEQVEKGVNSSTAEIKKQNQELDKQKDTLKDLQNALQALQTKNDSLDKTKTGLTQDFTNAKKEIEVIVGKMRELEGQKGGKTSVQYKKLAGELREAQAEAKTINQQLLSLDNTIDKNNASIAEYGTKIKAAKGAIADIDGTIRALQASAQQMPEGFDKLRQELAELKGVDISKIPTDLNQIGDIIRTLNDEQLKQIKQDLLGFNTAAESTGPASETAAKGMQDLNVQVGNLSERQKDLEQFANRIKYFFSIGNTVMLFRRAIKSAIDTVKELDEVMTQAAVVTKFTVADMWAQLPQYAQRANELGVTIKGVYEASTLYYQQGLDTIEVIGVANETLKMAKIAGIDYATATDYMTSALRGFNMEVNELSAQKVNDIYSQLAAKTASNVEEISVAMSKTAPLAHNAGMEIETTAALLAQMIERTREAPETLGTAMKTVIARFQELKKDPALIEPVEGEIVDANKIETALRTIGVSLRDTSGQFRNLDEVFLEISEKWDGLSTNTQRYIATIAAGSRQQSRFIAMMADYKRTMDLVGLANNAAGASAEQFAKTQDSLQSKINRLKTAWEQFTMGLANNQVIKAVVDLLTDFINLINKITDGLSNKKGFLKTLFDFGFLIGGIKLAKAAFNGFFSFLLKTGEKSSKQFSESINKNLQKVPVKVGIYAKQINNHFKEIFEKKGAINFNDFINEFVKVPQEIRQKMVQSSPEIATSFINSIKESIDYNSLNKTGQQMADKIEAEFKRNIQDGDLVKALNEAIKQFEYPDWSTLGGKKFTSNSNMNAKDIDALTKSFSNLSSGISSAGFFLNNFASTLDGLGLSGAANAVRGLGGAFTTLGGLISSAGAIITATGIEASLAWGWLLIIASLGVVIAGIIKNAKDNSITGRLKAAEESAKNAKEAADEAKDAYDKLLGEQTGYNETQEALKELTYGTQEWKDKLIEANQQVLELIQNMPELAEFLGKGEFGQLIIESAGWDKVIEAQRKKVLGLSYNNIEQQEQVRNVSLESTKKESGYVKLENKYGVDEIERMRDALANGNNALFEQLANDLDIFGDKLEETRNSILGYNEALKATILANENGRKAFFTSMLSSEKTQQLGSQMMDTLAEVFSKNESFGKEFSTEGFLPNDNKNWYDDSTFKELQKKYSAEIAKNGGIAANSTNLKALKSLYSAMADIPIEEVTKKFGKNKEELKEAIINFANSDIIEDKIDEITDNYLALNKADKEIVNILTSEGEGYYKGVDILVNNLTDAGEIFIKELTGKTSKELLDELIKLGDKQRAAAIEALTSKNISVEDFGNGMDAGMLAGFSDRLIKIFESSGSQVAGNFGTKIQAIFNELNLKEPEKAKQFMTALNSIDWKNANEVDTLSNKLDELGITANDLGIKDIDGLEKEIIQLAKAAREVDLEKLTDQIRSLGQIAYDIGTGKQGRNFSEEQMNQLVDQGIAKKSDFVFDFESGDFKYLGGSMEDLRTAILANTAALNGEAKASLEKQIAQAQAAEGIVNQKDEFGYDISGNSLVKQFIETGQSDKTMEWFNSATSEEIVAYANEIKQLVSDLPRLLDEEIARQQNVAINDYITQYQNNLEGLAEIALSGDEEAAAALKVIADNAGVAEDAVNELSAAELAEMTMVYKQATAHDIDAKELGQYANQLQKINKNLTKVEAAQVALGNARLNKGIKSLIDGYDNWTKVLDQTGGKLRNLSSEDAKVVQELGDGLRTMFDLTSEQTDSLIEKHYDLIKQVAEGSKEALAQLQEEAAKEVALDIQAHLHDEAAKAEIDEFIGFLNNIDLPELEPGMDLTNAWAGYDEFVRICSNLLTSGATTVEGLKAIFTNLGFEGDVEWTPQGEHDVVTPIIQAQERGTGALTNLTGEEIQSLKVKYWTPKFTFKSIGSGGGGVSPTITPASSGGGGGGGGGSSEDKTWENPYDWLYNLTQKINAELRTREKLEKRYQRLLKTYSGTGEDLKKIADQELASLEKRKQYEQEMIKLRRQELKEYLAANAALAKYAQIDWELEVVRIDWNQINAVTDPEEGEAIEKYIDKLEELIQSIRDAEDAIDDIDDEIIDLKQRGRDQYRDLEDRVLDALISEQQEMIDEQERIYDAINDAASDLMDAISKNIEKIRQDRQNEETETSLAEKERRLAYLRQDTTGSNALEIKKLEDELNKEKQNYTDTLIDQGLNDLKEQNDFAAEQREKQIQLMQSTLDWQQQTGYWVDEATRIVREGIGEKGIMDENSRLYKLLKDQEGYDTMSNASRAQWKDDLSNTIKEAYVYLENILKPSESGTNSSSTSNRDIMADIRAQAAMGRASNRDMSELQALENERNAKIDTLGVQDEWNKTNMVSSYKNGKNSYNNSTDGNVDWMAKINESIDGGIWDQAFYYAGKRDAKIEAVNGNDAYSTYSGDFTFEIVLEKWYAATKSHTWNKQFKTGGLADFTGPAWLDGSKSKPEMVLNARDTENFLQLKDILSNLRMSFSGSKGALGGDWYFDIDINVGEIANDYDVDQLTERVKQSIYTESTYRNVNAINFLK